MKEEGGRRKEEGGRGEGQPRMTRIEAEGGRRQPRMTRMQGERGARGCVLGSSPRDGSVVLVNGHFAADRGRYGTLFVLTQRRKGAKEERGLVADWQAPLHPLQPSLTSRFTLIRG